MFGSDIVMFGGIKIQLLKSIFPFLIGQKTFSDESLKGNTGILFSNQSYFYLKTDFKTARPIQVVQNMNNSPYVLSINYIEKQ